MYGGWVVVVYRVKVVLFVYQWVVQGLVLCYMYYCIVNGRVIMRVVFIQYFFNDMC